MKKNSKSLITSIKEKKRNKEINTLKESINTYDKEKQIYEYRKHYIILEGIRHIIGLLSFVLLFISIAFHNTTGIIITIINIVLCFPLKTLNRIVKNDYINNILNPSTKNITSQFTEEKESNEFNEKFIYVYNTTKNPFKKIKQKIEMENQKKEYEKHKIEFQNNRELNELKSTLEQEKYYKAQIDTKFTPRKNIQILTISIAFLLIVSSMGVFFGNTGNDDFVTESTSTITTTQSTDNTNDKITTVLETTTIETTTAETTTETTTHETTTEKTTTEKTTEKEATTVQSEDSGNGKSDNNNSRTVYRTPKGKCYHYSSECGGKNSYSISYDEAIESGLRPCEKCVK